MKNPKALGRKKWKRLGKAESRIFEISFDLRFLAYPAGKMVAAACSLILVSKVAVFMLTICSRRL